MSSKNGLDVLLSGPYEEGGPQTEDADISRRDEKILKGLEKAGFKMDDGPDDAGFFMKYFQRGGGYYIEIGCSQLIIDGKIKVKQWQEIEEFKPHRLLFKDGELLKADEVIFATGYENMRGTPRKIFGDDLAERIKLRIFRKSPNRSRLIQRRTLGDLTKKASYERCGGRA
ncbi:MAG: hypothetical protein Q9204_001264 [Flavoplaca sp. TL-2023a]